MFSRPPFHPPPSTPTFYHHADGSRRLGFGTIPETGGFVVVAEFPASVVFARANAFARQTAIASLLLILAGAIGAWLLSRGIIAPVRALVQASEALTRGDYTRRVVTERDDELGDLARTFSTMAKEMESSHRRLSEGYREAREMAATIEAANRQLTDAVTQAKRSRREAEAANRAKSEFVAMMSHELRTPISAIMGYADLLDMEIPGELNAEQRKQIERIRVNCDHLVTLIGDVLDLARVESGKLVIGRGSGRMGVVIEQALAAVAPDAARKGILLLPPEPDAPDPAFTGDEERARQILINLLSNAIKFTDAGGKVHVSTCCRTDSPGTTSVEHENAAGWACVSVRDTGIGIPADDLERIFEPFVQSDLNPSLPGVGLGLAISRRLAHLMGGDLTVTSEPGQGSTFTLILPLAPVNAPAAPAAPAKNPAPRAIAPARGPRRPARSPRAEPPSAHSG